MFEGFGDDESAPTYLSAEEAGDILAGHTILPQRPLRRNPSARNIERSNDGAPKFFNTVMSVTAVLPQEGLTEGDRIARIAEMERTKASITAAQARESAALEQQVIARHKEESKYLAHPNRGVASEIAMARMETQTKGPEFLSFSRDLISFMPCTFKALQLGAINAKMAKIIVSATKDLDPFDRELLDAEFMDDPESFRGVGLKELSDRINRVVLAVDSSTQIDRHADSISERSIRFHKSEDGSRIRFHGQLPIEQGIALQESLARVAAKQRDKADTRTKAQVAVDALVERVTGLAHADEPSYVINLIMTDRTLIQGDSEPAILSGYGVIPAAYARYLISGDGHRDIKESKAQAWIRRLYTAPGTGELIALESSKRIFPKQLKRMIALRDQYCRTPYCDAPIKHFDHVYQVARNGRTTIENSDGRCEWCNNTKEVDGWEERVVSGPRHTIQIETPSGQTYWSTAPPPPGADEPQKKRRDSG